MGTGYSAQQTRPQTLGYGLADSPMGQCSWVVEKFWDWTDTAGPPENVISRDRLLDNVMLYWLNNTGASSARLYWESFLKRRMDPVEVPTGVTLFPRKLWQLPRAWIEQRYTDLRHWSEPRPADTSPAWSNPTCSWTSSAPSSAHSGARECCAVLEHGAALTTPDCETGLGMPPGCAVAAVL